MHCVRKWQQQPIADCQLTLISAQPLCAYSAMLPGTMTGLYSPEEPQIDLEGLTCRAGVRLILAEASGLDPKTQRVEFANRPAIGFDAASVAVGSVPAGLPKTMPPGFVSTKPLHTLVDRLTTGLRQLPAGQASVAIVGGGAVGVELALCVSLWLKDNHRSATLDLYEAGPHILSEHRTKTIRIAERQLTAGGVRIQCNRRVTTNPDGSLSADGTPSIPADLVLWCAGAAPPPLLAAIDLPKSQDGFLLVDPTLQSVSHAPVFAAGDTAQIRDQIIPRSGVYAVRQGPVLWKNLKALLGNRPMENFRPQKSVLSLLSTGDGRAIGEYRGLSGVSRWLWNLKQRIDRSFLTMHQSGMAHTGMAIRNLRQTETGGRTAGSETGAIHSASPSVMRCSGCGGKTSSRVLSSVIGRLRDEHPHLAHPVFLQSEDAAVFSASPGAVDAASSDFFPAFLEDPWLTGRVAAIHSLSDLWARGIQPTVALAMVTLPEGSHRKQSELLYQVLKGGLQELAHGGAILAGGHTTNGHELTIGFTVLGQTQGQPLFSKGGLKPGQRLILTKPLGTGVILAARSAGRTRARTMAAVVQQMLISNQAASRIARNYGVTGATDVTGFGLAGHLLEMLDASGCSAELSLGSILLIDGAAELFDEGFRSSLDPENRAAESAIQDCAGRDTAAWHALFDPQTSGGLLLAVDAAFEMDALRELRAAGDSTAAAIGTVRATGRDEPHCLTCR